MKQLFKFLTELQANNNRDWFNAHKDEFKTAENEFKQLVIKIQEGLSSIDHIDKESTKVFRIYRDVRFSENKTPYHIHRSASFKRATVELRGGYYLRIEKGASRIVGGFFSPSSADIMHIRKQIQQDPEPLRDLLSSQDLIDYFGGIQGEQVKSAPRGFNKKDPAIDLLKFKQFLLKRPISDHEILSPDLDKKIVDGFAKMRPFFNYMSEILTTNLNGEPLI